MDKIIAQGLISKGVFNDFLTKGLYDPRIFLHIHAFILDDNYFAVCRQYPRYGYDPAEYENYQKHLTKVKSLQEVTGISISIIPSKYLTREMLIIMFTKGFSWYNVPKEKHSLELYFTYKKITRNGWNYSFSSNLDCRHYDICFDAVKQNGMALQFVNNRFQEEYLCLEAVKQNGLALQFVKDELKTYDVCFAAVEQNGLALQFIADDFNDIIEYSILHEMAVRNNGLALEFVVKKFKKSDF